MNPLKATALDAVAPQTNDERFEAMLNDVRTRARQGEFDRQRHISQDVIDAFKSHGIYRSLVPKRFGGDEASPGDFCRLIERISQADGSAGWVASFGMSPVYLAALPLSTIAQVYADGPDVVFAGGIFPPQPAERVEGASRSMVAGSIPVAPWAPRCWGSVSRRGMATSSTCRVWP